MAGAVEAGPGARSVFSRAQRLLLLAAFALIVVLRLPNAWAEGRFQDEEATVFLAYAWHYPWLDALFRPFAGYWNLGASATTVAAVQLVRGGYLPLERAPYFTMGVALAFQLLPAVLILTSKADWLARRLAVIAALLLIAISPATEEVFFNVLHIQFHLALCAALILALDVPDRPRVTILYATLLFIAPLCGPGPIVILPLFALRALVDRDRRRLGQLAWFAAGAAVQLLLFYGPSAMRGHLAPPGMLAAAMFVRMIALRFLGPDFANLTAGVILDSQTSGTRLWWWFAGAAVAAFSVIVAVASKRRDAALWLVLSSLSIGAASLGFGMVRLNDADLLGVLSGERYNFLPLVLLGLALIVLAMRPPSGSRPVFVGLCLLMTLSSAYYYSKTIRGLSSGSSWPAEVRAWRADHRHPLAVWPAPFTADLSDENRPCSPPGPNPGQSTDPRYCESGWVAGFYRNGH
ncbi:MAG: hypothetical protein ABIW33_00200 [Sphingomicrobium sp.]